MAVEFTPLNANSINNINTNFQRVDAALQDAISRSGNNPNQMNADLDMNSNDLLNVASIDTEILYINGEPVVPGDLGSIPPNSVGSNQIIDGSVGTAELADESVTLDKLDSSTVNISFDNKATAEAYTPVSPPNFIRIEGYTTAGDGGGALYKKVVSEPSHAGKFSITLQNASIVWYEIAETELSPKMFGAVGDGTTDDSAAMIACAALQFPVVIPVGVFVVENVVFRNNVRGTDRTTSVLKHKSNSSTVCFQVVSTVDTHPIISNLTVDGDFTNQIRDVGQDTKAVSVDGYNITFQNVSFKRSVYCAMFVMDFRKLLVTGCSFTEMAQHGGTTGQQTMAVILNSTRSGTATFNSNEFINVNSPSLSAPGGVLATSGDISMVFESNRFFRIGQGLAGNFIGCIDAYQEGQSNIINGNLFEEICYSAVKLSSSRENVVTNNIINGFDSGTSTAIPTIVVAYRGGGDQITLDTIISNNRLGGVYGAGKSGIEVYGASGFTAGKVIISGNTVRSTGFAILAQHISTLKIVNNDVSSSATGNVIRTFNLPNAYVDISNNTVNLSVAGIPIDLTSADGSSGAILSATGNEVISSVTWAVALRADGIARAKVNNNTFRGFGTSTVRLYNIAGGIVTVGNLTDGNTTLDTTGSTGSIKNPTNGNTWS